MKNLCIFKSSSPEDEEIMSMTRVIETLPQSFAKNDKDDGKYLDDEYPNRLSCLVINRLLVGLKDYCPPSTFFGACEDEQRKTVFPKKSFVPFFIERAIEQHCVVSSLYTSLYLKCEDERINLAVLPFDMEKAGRNYSQFNNHSKFKHLTEITRHGKIWQTCTLWKEYSAYVISHLKDLTRIFNCKSSQNLNSDDMLETLKTLETGLCSNKIESTSIDNSIRQIMHRYMIERYYHFDLVKTIFQFTKEMLCGRLYSDWSIEEIASLLSLTRFLPNAFSRGSFLEFAIASRYNNYLRSNHYNTLQADENSPMDFTKSKTPEAFIPYEWAILFMQYIAHLSCITIPLYEKVFYCRLLKSYDYNLDQVIKSLTEYIVENNNRISCRVPYEVTHYSTSGSNYEDSFFHARQPIIKIVDKRDREIFKAILKALYQDNYFGLASRPFTADYFSVEEKYLPYRQANRIDGELLSGYEFIYGNVMKFADSPMFNPTINSKCTCCIKVTDGQK